MVFAEQGPSEPSSSASGHAKSAQSSLAERASSSAPNADEWEDLESDAFADQTQPRKAPPTLGEAFKAEFELVYRTWVFVMKSWFTFPKRAGEILFVEAWRVWAQWLGKPVPERVAAFRFPGREEL